MRTFWSDPTRRLVTQCDAFAKVGDWAAALGVEVFVVIKSLERFPDDVAVTEADVDAVLEPLPLTGRTLQRSPSGDLGSTGLSRRRSLIEWFVVVGAAAATALLVRTTALQMFYIPSESMSHTLEVDDKVMVDKLTHRLSGVSRGDIVVFHRPVNLQGTTVKDLVKRVIAVEGDTIESVNGQVFVNDEALTEPYLVEQGVTRNLPRTSVGANQLFMMGDNRERSSDSRVFGPISEATVVGHARAIVFRRGKLHIERP